MLATPQAAEPTYDHLAWAEHEKLHEEYMKNICELPIVINSTSEGFLDQRDEDEDDDREEYKQEYA